MVCRSIQLLTGYLPGLNPIGSVMQMQDFQGEDGVTLQQSDTFSNQVDKVSWFYHWDEQEACRQARVHLRDTTLAHVSHVRGMCIGGSEGLSNAAISATRPNCHL